ncbi:class I SAM-dependent methyltransferase [Winogradskyella aurantia]|uniref:class I SAM-dependent methyltransferase n=1 Tax=Winogradskyella aurantia TaxID=1915063 RepID=UPI001F0A88D5|nr:class I SAM-dependent methyltransferase [Winogradskyella aurantia]
MKILKNILNKLPYVRGLYAQAKRYNENAFFPPGHFYSSVTNLKEIKQREDQIWRGVEVDYIKGLDLRTEAQIELLTRLSDYYSELPFPKDKNTTFRYYFENPYYLYTDGIILYGLMRYLKPKRIIEVGSGFSSALMLDVNEHYFGNSINFMFIEPFPNRLNGILRKEDINVSKIVERKVQDVDIEIFKQLKAGDILFIDSTHVSKCGSDVNFLLFEVLPVLNKDVYIHFHDVFYPFEYPKEWVFKGYNWNENYILRSFLMYNKAFQIEIFADYLHKHHKSVFSKMPLAFKNTGGNLWIKKV